DHRCVHDPVCDLLPGRAVWRRAFQHELRDPVQSDELHRVGAGDVAHQVDHDFWCVPDAVAGHFHLLQRPRHRTWEADHMSSEYITIFMFASMLLLMATGQRVFGVIGFVGSAAALALWGKGSFELPFNAAFQVLNWYPLITVPFFVFMGYLLSESGIANNLYRMFHVWFGGVRGGLAIGTMGLMIIISMVNGLSVAGMAIGATVALPELLRRGYDK